ncbi:MAG: competence protein CoiA family protein [Betaproteobacteria bacterium]
MPKDILYSFANNENGDLVGALLAKRGATYFCPSCQTEMVHRKGEKVRPHFAHKSLSPNCSPETVLHFGFKRLLRERISRSINAGAGLAFQWKCDSCCGSHTGNLLKRATHAEEELNLGICRPDIALLSKDGNVAAAIEIVVTHPPEQSVISFYKANRIPLIVFELKSDTELSRVDEEVLKPDIVDACLSPKCPKCKRHMSRMKLLIIDGKCWKCNSPMKVGALKGDAGYEPEFSSNHIALANQNGANIKTRYSKTVQERYAANTCRRCNAFIGGHYLSSDYIAPAEYGEYPCIELDADFYCPACCNDIDPWPQDQERSPGGN